MITVTIHEETSTAEDMAIVLERIAELIQQGYKRGVNPAWEVEGEEEPDEEDY